MRNRLLALICILSVSLTLVACGNKEDNHDTSVPSTQTGVLESETSTEEEVVSPESTEIVKDEEESETPPSATEPQPEAVASGTLAENKIEWKIIGTTLYVSGTGAISDFPESGAWFEAHGDSFPDMKPIAWEMYYKDVDNVVLSEGITSIGAYNFCGFSKVTSFTFPSTLTKIGKHGMNGMGLTSLEISKNITELDWGAFQNLTNITYVYIPANIKKISGGCFANCYSLSKIDIEEGVERIDEGAFTMTEFYDGNGVKHGGSHGFEIHIPGSVTFIEEGSIYASGYDSSSVTIYGKEGSYAEEWANEINTYVGVSFVAE